MTDHKRKPLLVIALVAAIASAAAAGLSVQNMQSTKEVRAELTALKAKLPVAQGYGFTSETDFQEAVVKSLNRMVKDKQARDMEAKAKRFKLASNDAPGNKKIYGDLNARFTLVEFSETECPFCLKHHPVMKNIVDSSGGNINWEWKHLPLSFHNPAALQQAIVGECVAEQLGNRGFWIYIDEVFKKSSGGGKGVADLSELVESMGVDMGTLRECVGSNRGKEIVESDLEQGSKLNISGTPATIVVDNHTGRSHIISGAQPAGAFMSVIERMLKEEQNAASAPNADAAE